MKHLISVALPLLASGLLAQGTAEVEPNSNALTATALALGGQATGAINAPADADYYAITLSAASDLRLWANAGFGTSMHDSEVTLFDIDGTTQLAFNDDVSNANWMSRIVIGNLPAGTYFVRVRSSQAFLPNGVGTYTLDVVAAPLGTYVPSGSSTPTLVGEGPENNDPRFPGSWPTWSFADSLNFGRIHTGSPGTGFNDPGVDYDWFRVQIPQPGTLRMWTRGGVNLPMGDTVLHIAGPGGASLAFDDDSGPGLYSFLEFQVVTGYYYVVVKGWDIGSYELDVRLLTPVPTGAATVTMHPGGCGPTLGVRIVPVGPPAITEVPVLGSSFYLDGNTNLANASLLRMIGLSPLGVPFSLASLGAPGCQVEVDLLGYTFALANANGIDHWLLTSPIDPIFIGLPIHQQLAVLDSAANGLGMTVSNRVSSAFGITN